MGWDGRRDEWLTAEPCDCVTPVRQCFRALIRLSDLDIRRFYGLTRFALLRPLHKLIFWFLSVLSLTDPTSFSRLPFLICDPSPIRSITLPMTLSMTPSTSTCPRCGHCFDNTVLADTRRAPSPSGSVVWAQQEEVALIQDEVRRLNDLIYRLNQDRAGLLRKINSVQASTRRLPPEVLSTIFQFARPPIDFTSRSIPTEFPDDPDLRRGNYVSEDDFQLVLGAVSYHWRQVVWSTPQLWTTISVEVYEIVSENNASLLSLYFENARGLPMTIELDLRAQLLLLNSADDPEQRAKSISTLDPIKTSVFVDNANKIRSLILTGLPMEWISSIGRRLSQCESMTLYWPQLHITTWTEYSNSVDLSDLPCLRQISLKDLRIPLIPYWPAITVLKLRDLPIKECVELLTKCPNLIEFESLQPYSHTARDNLPSFDKPIVLEHLESLKWHTTSDEWSYAFLRHVRFAKLRLLKWSGSHQSIFVEEFSEDLHLIFISFFADLPTTLQVLELVHFPYSYSIVKDLLSSVSHLPELHLRQCSSRVVSMAVSMIGRPIAGLFEDRDRGRAAIDPTKAEGPKVTPSLKTLVLDNYCDPDAEMVAEMLEALHGVRETRERFRLVLSEAEPWEPEVLTRIRRLAMSGFDLEIVQRSHTLDFMSSPVESSGGNLASAPS